MVTNSIVLASELTRFTDLVKFEPCEAPSWFPEVVISPKSIAFPLVSVSYTHLTLPTKRIV